MGEGGRRYEIVNIVAYANLDTELDLYNLALNLDNVEYEPEQFPGAILRVFDPKATLLIFKNGKLICTGTRDDASVRKAIEIALGQIKEALPNANLPSPEEVKVEVENIVAASSIGREVDLYLLAELYDNVEYEPEQFPGVIIKLGEGKPTILLFKNGKLICAGARSEKDVEAALDELEKLIENASKAGLPF
jgi:transcription initiation factor TFIID TATA-box-binding protein